MPAIPAHKTATDTKSAWDGPAEIAKAPNEEKTLRYMCAWVEAGGDPDAKSSYKFPHHDAGTDTAANIHGVDNALARLSQADIPDADRAGVKAHLEAHRKDAGLEDSARGHTPIRCFEGTAKPHEPFWRWVDQEVDPNNPPTEDDPVEMELYGYISEYSWSEDEITPAMFKQDLMDHGKGGPVLIKMNSYGGDVIAASVMSTIIKDYPGQITVQVDGIAASAATVVAVAADKVRMQDTAYFMIHDPMAVFFLAMLNIDELSTMVDQLKVVKAGIVNAYSRKTGLSEPKLSKLMSDETWMDAKTAQNLGFCDEIITASSKKKNALPVSVANSAMVNALNHYQHVPEALRDALKPPVVSPPEPTPEVLERDRALAELRDYLDVFSDGGK